MPGLAQLSAPARELAGVAATIGRAFTVELLVKASRRSEESLAPVLDELWERRVIQRQGEDSYDFSHDKLREVAYAEVGPARRRLLHRWVAEALETISASDLDAVSSHLARHYEQAGMQAPRDSFFTTGLRNRVNGFTPTMKPSDTLTRALELLAVPATNQRARRAGT